MNFAHKFNNIFALYSLSCHFLKNFFAYCARSIAFYPPLRNESMQCALPTPFIAYFSFFGSLSLTDSFQNSLKARIKLHKIAYTMSKNCPVGVVGKKGEGVRRENGGGDSAMVVGGIDAPGQLGYKTVLPSP